jgi:hypothetical protein
MPHYTNTDSSAHRFPGYDDGNGSNSAAAGTVVLSWDYVWPIPTGFELTSHNDPNGNKRSPWTTLHNAVLGAGVTLTDLEQYDLIRIVNGSGDDISIVANEDTDALIVSNGGTFSYVQPKDKKDLSKLVITGSGSTAINVTGWNS